MNGSRKGNQGGSSVDELWIKLPPIFGAKEYVGRTGDAE